RAEGAPFRSPDLFVEGLAEGSAGRPAVELSEAGHRAQLTVPLRGTTAAGVAGKSLTLTLVDGARAAQFAAVPQAAPVAGPERLLPILAIALFGGLILNVMPCVLPVVSLKLISVAGQAAV